MRWSGMTVRRRVVAILCGVLVVAVVAGGLAVHLQGPRPVGKAPAPIEVTGVGSGAGSVLTVVATGRKDMAVAVVRSTEGCLDDCYFHVKGVDLATSAVVWDTVLETPGLTQVLSLMDPKDPLSTSYWISDGSNTLCVVVGFFARPLLRDIAAFLIDAATGEVRQAVDLPATDAMLYGAYYAQGVLVTSIPGLDQPASEYVAFSFSPESDQVAPLWRAPGPPPYRSSDIVGGWFPTGSGYVDIATGQPVSFGADVFTEQVLSSTESYTVMYIKSGVDVFRCQESNETGMPSLLTLWDTATEQAEWAQGAPIRACSDQVEVADGVVYLTQPNDPDWSTAAYSLADGRQLWASAPGLIMGLAGGVPVTTDFGYANQPFRTLRTLDRATGDVLDEVKVPDDAGTAVYLFGSGAFVCTPEARAHGSASLSAYDMSDRIQYLWKLKVPAASPRGSQWSSIGTTLVRATDTGSITILRDAVIEP